MRNDKQSAIKLRKGGKSYNQISKELGIPKSTLSSWLKDFKISQNAQSKINSRAYALSIKALINRNIAQTSLAAKRHQKILSDSSTETHKLINDKLFLSGVMLYWGEGYKKGAEGSKWKCVDFANCDPAMIRLMMKFFKKFCSIPENSFRFQITGHQGMDKEKAVDFWQTIVNAPKDQFTKIYIAKQKHKPNTENQPFGTIHIRISNVEIFFQLIGWIDGVKKHFKI